MNRKLEELKNKVPNRRNIISMTGRELLDIVWKHNDGGVAHRDDPYGVRRDYAGIIEESKIVRTIDNEVYILNLGTFVHVHSRQEIVDSIAEDAQRLEIVRNEISQIGYLSRLFSRRVRDNYKVLQSDFGFYERAIERNEMVLAEMDELLNSQ